MRALNFLLCINFQFLFQNILFFAIMAVYSDLLFASLVGADPIDVRGFP